MSRHGWFRVAGQSGDRTPEEQLKGLQPALAVCNGKRVLDLGCAEGAISREFAMSGAHVFGLDMLEDHLAVARQICQGMTVKFVRSELAEWIRNHPEPEQFDIVLALSVAHKLHHPGMLITFAARSAREMVVFRGPGKVGMMWDGWLKAKHRGNKCHVPTIFAEHGFTEGETLPSGHGERVQYWHKS